MPPRLVVCRCCASGKPAFACCDVCEAREHPSNAAWDALCRSYYLDECDADDRARDAADDYRLGASA